MIQDLANELVIDYNLGNSMSQLAKKYKIQHTFVRTLLFNSGSQLRRPEFLTESELKALAKQMTFDKVAEYLCVQPITLKRHLKKRKITLPILKSKDDIYIEKQVTYLYCREGMPANQIARSLYIELNRVFNIIRMLKANGLHQPNRHPASLFTSIGESGGKFIEHHDLANVFPKQRQYAKAY